MTLNKIIHKNKILSMICIFKPDNIPILKDFVRILNKYSDVALIVNDGCDYSDLLISEGIYLINDFKNYGTLNGYNITIERYHSYDYFWLWNQDTFIYDEELLKFLRSATVLFDSDEKMSAVTLYDSRNFIWPIFDKMILFKESTTILHSERVRYYCDRWFDEYFFMDVGDWDLALRIQKSGGLVRQIHGIKYMHSLGDEEMTIFGPINRPSLLRLYMQGLNFYRYVFVYRRFDFIFSLLFFRTIFILPFKNFLFKNGFKRNVAYFKGVLHGMRGVTSSSYMIKR